MHTYLRIYMYQSNIVIYKLDYSLILRCTYFLISRKCKTVFSIRRRVIQMILSSIINIFLVQFRLYLCTSGHVLGLSSFLVQKFLRWKKYENFFQTWNNYHSTRVISHSLGMSKSSKLIQDFQVSTRKKFT